MSGVLNRRVAVALLAVVALAMVAGVIGGPAAVEAQGRVGPKPQGGAWCGLAEGQSPVFIEVSSDGRYVNSISIRTPEGVTFSTAEQRSGNYRTQIARSYSGLQFIYRGGREPRNPNPCTRRPCPDPPQYPNKITSIRGTFKSPTSLRGTYTGTTQQVDDGNRRVLPRPKRLVGSYVAWPASQAPCP